MDLVLSLGHILYKHLKWVSSSCSRQVSIKNPSQVNRSVAGAAVGINPKQPDKGETHVQGLFHRVEKEEEAGQDTNIYQEIKTTLGRGKKIYCESLHA